MQVSFNLSNLFRYARVNPTGHETPALSTLAAARQQDITQLSLNDRRVARLEATVTELDDLLARAEVRIRPGHAKAISRSLLDLSTVGTATTLDSTEQVNTAATSYSPFGPVFAGSGLSTALPEISGVYDGSNGNDTLRFKVTRTGVHGSSRIDVKVYDSSGSKIGGTIKIQPWHAADREYNVGNGLKFSVGAGKLVRNDDLYIDVRADTPSAVDADKPFNGSRDNRPDFDDGHNVVAGSFDINGNTITVNADDTINLVLQRINESDADVDAVFDVTSETVQLTRRSTGSAHDIVLQNDTTGFVAATKLDGTATPGLDQETDAPLSVTSRFSGVGAGNLNINGNSIAIDPVADSLSAIVARINDADIGVSARLVNDGQRVLLRSSFAGAPLSLNDNGTQLFDALDIVEKTYKPRNRNGFSRSQSYRIADRVEDTAALLNEVFDPGANPANDSQALNVLRQGIVAALRGTAPDGDSGFGVRFALDAPVRSNFASVERRSITSAQNRNASGAQRFFQGLAVSLRGALGAYQSQFGLNASGVLLNTSA